MVATVINSDAPPTNPALPNNEGLAQNEANIPERPVLGDQDTDNSSLEDDFFAPPPPRAKLLPMPKSKFDPSLLADGRQRIKARGESLDTPFVHISDAIRNSLQDAKRIQGGPKQLLARLERLARRVTVKRVVGDIDSEVEEDPNSSEDFLECIRCMMVVEATMLKSGSKRPIGNKGNGARKPCRIGSIRVPPGGELNVDGRSGESPQAIEQLEIKEYSNEVYWRFAPYLDPVRCTLKPTRKCITDYFPKFRSSVLNLRSCTDLIVKVSMVSRRRTLRSCVATRKARWSQASWRPKGRLWTIRALPALPACGSCISSAT